MSSGKNSEWPRHIPKNCENETSDPRVRLWGVGGTESLGEVVIFKRVEDSSMPCQDLPASPTMQSLRRVRFSPFLITSLPSQKDLASSAFIPYKACEKVPLKEEI